MAVTMMMNMVWSVLGMVNVGKGREGKGREGKVEGKGMMSSTETLRNGWLGMAGRE